MSSVLMCRGEGVCMLSQYVAFLCMIVCRLTLKDCNWNGVCVHSVWCMYVHAYG